MAMNLRDLLIDVCHPFLLIWADNSVKPKKLPGKADHHCQELPGGQRHLGAMPIIWPRGIAFMHQQRHAVAPSIGKALSAMWMSHTEGRHNKGERFLRAGAHIHELVGPNGGSII